MKKKLVIIDGKSVFYRGYYAMRNLSLPDGTPMGGVYGFAAMLLEIVKDLSPDYAVVAWDKAKTNIRKRREIYDKYKANREAAPDDFYAQIPYLMELLDAFGVPLYECDDYEADDIIGTLARKAAAEGMEVDLVSGDLDMLQIVDENIQMYQMKRGFSDVERFDIAAVEAKYGLKKDQFLDLKALKGDASDNIPGVPGIGEKGAAKLLNAWGTLENIYANVDKISGAIGKKLVEGKDLAFMSKKLSAIMFDAPVELDLAASGIKDVDDKKVLSTLERFEFRSLMGKYRKIRAGFLKTTEVDEEEPGSAALDRADTKALPDDLLIARDVKQKMHADREFAQKILGGEEFWDLGQVAFLLDPLKRNTEDAQLGLDFDDAESLAKDYWGQQDELAARPKLKEVIFELDFPLVPILYKMENLGIKINRSKFEKLDSLFAKEIAEVEQKIYTMAGREFNINSPMQLSEVLYQELALPTKGIKKKQKFYSTGQSELDKLRGLHPIIEEIERIREITKLLTTYVRPLPSLADENGRVHTTYTQNVTATGRLSSVNPNLQNIPVRKEEGRWIREGFVADEGKVFVSADYAQFELRLAAALAGDEELVRDFNKGLDVHTKTASDVFKVPMEEVTSAQRRAAKVINFGVLYGMSARGLSLAADMSMLEAKEFIEKYFEVRKPIRAYLDKTLAEARNLGYVETIFGRRRPTPDIKSPNFAVRNAAERAAANMPIQGTEADLMKKAMIRIDKVLPSGANLVLQVHDSLVVECDERDKEEIAKILQENMEGICPEISVKLAVDVTVGRNWGEL